MVQNWLVRKNPPKVTIYNENGLLVCRAIYIFVYAIQIDVYTQQPLWVCYIKMA